MARTAAKLAETYTVGHSTHDVQSFLALLAKHEIALLVDVRRFPGSRRHPQFNIDALERFLGKHGVHYLHLAGLGGHRKPRQDSPNSGWEVETFRGYADHLESEEFKSALGELMEQASRSRAAAMCAEGLWWKCHRRLLSDALVASGWRVRHIMPDGAISDHRLTDFAVLNGQDLSYPAVEPTLPVV